jgi:hypothetical protein
MADETITLKIVAQDLASGNISKFVAGLDTMAKKGGLMGSVLQGVGQSFGQMLNPIALVSKGIDVLGNVVADSIKAFGESQVIQAQTVAVLKSTGDAAGVTADQIGNLANAVSSYSGQDDEAIQKGENLLLTFTNIKDAAGAGNDVFTQTTRVMADMAQAMGGDAAGQAILLGKALNDPLKGLTALTRVGVTFTAQQKAEIAAFTRMGDVAGAQKVILAELNKEFGGSAKAFGDTLPGAVSKFNVAFGNLEENIGGALAGPLADLATWFTKMMGVVPPVSDAVQAQLDTWKQMAGQAPATAAGAQQVGDAIAQSGDKSVIGLLAIEEHLTGLAGLWDQRADAKLWADQMQDLGDKLGVTGQALDNYVQAGIDAGQTQDEIRASLQKLIDTQDQMPASAGAAGAAVKLMSSDFADAQRHVGNEFAAGLNKAVKAAATFPTSIKNVIESGKGEVRAAMADIAWALKHPFADDQYVKWLKGQIRKAEREKLTAQKQGDTKLVAEIDATVKAEQALIDSITGRTVRVNVDIYNQTRHPLLGGGRAAGGPVMAGVPYLVGEQHAEVFVPSQNGTILPNVPSGGGIHVHFHSAYPPSPMEGERIAQALAPHLRREMTRIGA